LEIQQVVVRVERFGHLESYLTGCFIVLHEIAMLAILNQVDIVGGSQVE
jgi:hypothetical protein